MKRHRTKSERITHRVQSLIRKIQGLELESSLIEEKIKSIQEGTPDKLIRVLGLLPPQKAIQLLYEIYWSNQKLAAIVALVYRSLFTGAFRVPSKKFEFPCERCGEPAPLEVKSWTELKQKRPFPSGKRDTIFCTSCTQRRKEEECRTREESTRNAEEWYRRRDEEIERLRTMPYSEYLQTAHWQQVRIRALKRAGFRCQLCNKEGRLNVHHRTYERRGYEYSNDVITLCESCHEKFHDVLPQKEEES